MIEWSWLAISLAAGALTVTNLLTGWGYWQSVRQNGSARATARGVAAWANVRRDIFRLLSIVGCLIIIIPAWLRPGDTPFSGYVLAAMLIPVGIAINSFLDRRDRLRIEALLA